MRTRKKVGATKNVMPKKTFTCVPQAITLNTHSLIYSILLSYLFKNNKNDTSAFRKRLCHFFLTYLFYTWPSQTFNLYIAQKRQSSSLKEISNLK